MAAAIAHRNVQLATLRDHNQSCLLEPTDVSFPAFSTCPCYNQLSSRSFLYISLHCDNAKLTATQAIPSYTTEKQETSSMNTMHPMPLVSKQLPRPNTLIHYTLFIPHKIPMPVGQLRLEGWRELTRGYADQGVITQILGMCQYGAQIGYEGQRSGIVIHPNLASAEENPEQVTADIEVERNRSRFETYPDSTSLPDYYTASPVSLADK